MATRCWPLCVFVFLTASPLAAQSAAAGRTGPRIMLPRAREIALARSAAPADVSKDAGVMVLTERGFEVAVTGTNGVTCVVNRSHPRSLEPHCFDAEGSATVLPIELRRTELLREGRTAAEIDREIGEGLLSGKYRLPRRPAMSYMMSSGQILYDDEGKHVGRWHPHIMIFYPNLTASDLGLGTTPSTDAAVLVDPGKPLSNVMVLVQKFVDPLP
ncbi:MAG TPA: hypothetical protein VEB59_05195 [Gemmatimonadales bacterium]|nr:hypothetical protein [Gemmatimonadales bacterium]